MFSQAAGGLFGQGFGQAILTIPGYSTPHYLLPAPDTDMIYAVLTNEIGLFGAAAVLIAYLLFVARGLQGGGDGDRLVLHPAGHGPERGASPCRCS